MNRLPIIQIGTIETNEAGCYLLYDWLFACTVLHDIAPIEYDNQGTVYIYGWPTEELESISRERAGLNEDFTVADFIDTPRSNHPSTWQEDQ